LIGRPKYMLAVDMPDCVSLAYATEQDSVCIIHCGLHIGIRTRLL